MSASGNYLTMLQQQNVIHAQQNAPNAQYMAEERNSAAVFDQLIRSGIRPVSPAAPLTLRQELQKETDEWLAS